MKISNIQLKEEGESVLLTADCKIRHIGTDEIYFKFEKKYRDFISPDASAFAVALLIPSMKMGQDLIIEGAVSERLYQGMHEIMKIMLSWNLGLKSISIFAQEIKKDSYEPERKASFFSGGVDSFYTYLKHLETVDEKIDYFILANGFDISLKNPELWRLACQTVEEVAKSEEIEIIKVESNIRDFIEPVEIWDYTHGGCLAALGLALRKELKDVFIPSSLAVGQLLPWGSHPKLDSLWSTETLSFYHDGAETKRVDKVKFIAQNPLTLRNLRVCYRNEDGKFNCGVCDKCLRTMVNLRVAGALDKSETFPNHLDLEVIRKIKIAGEQCAILHKENLRELRELGIEEELQTILQESIDRFYSPRFSLKEEMKKMRFYFMEGINKIRLFDFFYNQDRLYNFKNYLLRKIKRRTKTIDVKVNPNDKKKRSSYTK
ncbi:MAG: hypothetical protein WC178_02340 [Candidatus Paceibacterota bacterium]